MEADKYAEFLGKLIANLNTLEFVLRVYLYSKADPPHTAFPLGKMLDNYKVGDEVPLNAISCYDSLGDLIVRYNNIVAPAYQVDPSIVDIRDAFAHGRIVADDPEIHPTLVKTSKPNKSGIVRITYKQELTSDWITIQVKHLHKEVLKVLSIPGFQP